MYNNINITEDMSEELDDYQRLAQDEPKDEVLVSDTMGQDLAKLFRKGHWTDVTLAVRDRRFNAHRLILSTRSTYFKNLFESEPDKLLFDLDAAFNPVAFELVLEYLYSATAVVSRKLADDVTEIALKLEIKSLTEALAGFSGTKLSKENVLQEIQRYFGKNKAALEHCLRYLDHHINNIGIDNLQLLTMPVEIMNEIVKRQTLGVHEEADVLRLLVNWKREQLLNNDAEVVQKQATQLAQHLKLHLLHPESFFQTLKPTGWFSTEVLWDTLTELINSDRGYPIRSRDNDDPKYTARKPGPKKLKPKRKNGVLQPTDVPVAILGYEASGKTTMLYKLKLGEVVTTIPTIGFNVESAEYKRTKFTLTDCGARVKNTWMDVVSPRTEALIWVVDSNDRDTDLLVEGVELKEIFDKFGKPDMPLLVIANKQDLPNARSVAEICELMGLRDLGFKKWYIQAACATSGDGLYEGLDWLHHQIEDDE